MLSKQDLIKKLDKKYESMINQISIADFTKCVAQFSGLDIKDVSDKAIEDYLTKWAINKYKYFKMLGDKIRLDTPIEYVKLNEDKEMDFENIEREFPVYALWIENLKGCSTNKIVNRYDIDFDARDCLTKLFPTLDLIGVSLTHLFKKYLNAPDELVTAIGRIYENDKIKGIHTISIDPVDMMLASENPYGWHSCYKLDVEDSNSHADGCLASVIDTSTLITYIWSSEGKFTLRDKYTFKNIRYKKMRQWISISPNQTAIHFNTVYPGKSSYSDEFEKQLRGIVEDVVSSYLKVENIWKRNPNMECDRKIPYGYGEYSSYNIYSLSKAEELEGWTVFDEPIICPCGCGQFLPGNDWDEDNTEKEYYWTYNGNGFTYENHYEYETGYFCNYMNDYCYCSNGTEDECRGCSYWEANHPVCNLNTNQECLNPEWSEEHDGIVEANDNHCKGCPLYKVHHQNNEITLSGKNLFNIEREVDRDR